MHGHLNVKFMNLLLTILSVDHWNDFALSLSLWYFPSQSVLKYSYLSPKIVTNFLNTPPSRKMAVRQTAVVVYHSSQSMLK